MKERLSNLLSSPENNRAHLENAVNQSADHRAQIFFGIPSVDTPIQNLLVRISNFGFRICHWHAGSDLEAIEKPPGIAILTPCIAHFLQTRGGDRGPSGSFVKVLQMNALGYRGGWHFFPFPVRCDIGDDTDFVIAARFLPDTLLLMLLGDLQCFL